MYLESLKQLINEIEAAGTEGKLQVCVPDETHDFWGTVHAHPAISLLRQKVYTGVDGKTTVIHDHSRIYMPDGEELAEMRDRDQEVNMLGYYNGQPVREVLVFTF